MIELKPCPFCGGEAEVERQGTSRQSCIISCTECGCRHEGPDEYEQCGYQWNIRATDEVMPAAIPLEVFANAKNLIIRIGIETLCHAVSFGRPYGQGDIKITDRDLFIKGLLLELISESEDGTTPVHSMFDEAVNQMLENGEEGLDFEEPTE